MSPANKLLLGFTGIPMPGARLIVGDEDIAKTWEVIMDEPDFKYGHLVLSWYPLLSSISFDRFRLPNTPFVIQFPSNNLRPGAPAELGLMLPQASNQVWTIQRSESFPQYLSYSDSFPRGVVD